MDDIREKLFVNCRPLCSWHAELFFFAKMKYTGKVEMKICVLSCLLQWCAYMTCLILYCVVFSGDSDQLTKWGL